MKKRFKDACRLSIGRSLGRFRRWGEGLKMLPCIGKPAQNKLNEPFLAVLHASPLTDAN